MLSIKLLVVLNLYLESAFADYEIEDSNVYS